ncbi:hypothetical protein EC973_005088 [Apophysomyces ossiformis]|uniref:DSC E3 ubiquitin ligase complex subunit 3 C-terminal domain-containing protein n=1 Tax=Apophysomyces ossiformis TaxID=679940 RepID=A0A8H7BJI9_9FUNG|nr:hypothetical protein EC973_005088 [Apophysomyces ossiformis]
MQDPPQITPMTGFDRLRESGFNEEEIRSIRTQFHRMHGTAYDGGGKYTSTRTGKDRALTVEV